ncbi:MAG: M23 family metallopeptidase, partial [Chloroflexi bacterium]
GFDTLYGHLSTALVKVGQPVTQGQVVGLEGSSGSSTGPHLHFELRINQKPVDPTPYLPPGAPSAYRV